MEYQNHESRHVFLAISVVLLLTCPLFLPVIPQTVTNIMHHKSEIWHVFTPNESYMAFAIGFFLLFLSSLTLFFLDIKKMSIFISVLLVLISIGCFMMAALPYKTLGDEGISFKEFMSTDVYTYSWEEVEKINRIDMEDKGFYDYEFLFTDGNKMSISYNGYFREILGKLGNQIAVMKIEVVTVNE